MDQAKSPQDIVPHVGLPRGGLAHGRVASTSARLSREVGSR